VLPFGLATAPRVFTKVTAPVVALARSEGIHLMPYLDDWLIKNPVRPVANTHGGQTAAILDHHGWLVNWKKSELEASQDREFIGAQFRTDVGQVFLPQARRDDMTRRMIEFATHAHRSARQFLVILGLMNACIEVVPYARLMMRPIQMYLLAHWRPTSKDLEFQIPVRPELVKHLEWWQSQSNLAQGIPLVEPEVQETMFTDASDSGWGGFLESGGQIQGQWVDSSLDPRAHINLRELEAVFRTCRYFEHRLKGKHILVRCDNATVVAYLNKQGGTKSPTLCMKMWEFFHWLRPMGITIQALHVPGVENERADYLSRVFSSSLEWQLLPSVVQQIFLRWDRPHVDLFASEHNNQLPVYCSRYWEPRALQPDALQMSWEGVFGYAFPPLSLVPLALEKIRKCKCLIILIAPCWPRRSWYSQILDLLVDLPIQLPVREDLLSQDKGRLLHPRPEDMNLMAWKLSAETSRRKEFLKRLRKLSWSQLDPVPGRRMPRNGRTSSIGVVSGMSVPVQHL